MATYSVPPDFSEKEKIVGGVLTAAQLICMVIGLAMAAVFSLVLFPFMGPFAIILGSIIFIPLGIAFALVNIKGLTLISYLRKKKYHGSIVKKLPNKRAECDNFKISYKSVRKIKNG